MVNVFAGEGCHLVATCVNAGKDQSKLCAEHKRFGQSHAGLLNNTVFHLINSKYLPFTEGAVSHGFQLFLKSSCWQSDCSIHQISVLICGSINDRSKKYVY